MKKRLIIALAVVLGCAFMAGPGATKKAEALPPASFVCQYMADHGDGLVPGMEILYAEYDFFNTQYARAACWMKDPSAGVVFCTFYARYYVNGTVAGPDNLHCNQ